MLYFGDRGSQEFKGDGLFDMSINYNVPVFRTLRPWVKLDVLQSVQSHPFSDRAQSLVECLKFKRRGGPQFGRDSAVTLETRGHGGRLCGIGNA